MNKLSKIERHPSLTSQQRGAASRLFIALFVNTAVIILIVNADLSPYFGQIGLGFLLSGHYTDFVRLIWMDPRDKDSSSSS